MLFNKMKKQQKSGNTSAQNIEGFTTFQILLLFLQPFWKYIGFSFLLLTVVEVIRMAIPYALGQITQVVSDQGFMSEVYPWVFIGLAAFVLVSVIDFLRDMLESRKLDWILPHTIFLKMADRLVGLSIGQMQSSHSGFKQSVINRGMSSVRNIVMTLMYQVIPILMQIIIATIITIVIAPEVGWFLLLALMILAVVLFVVNPRSVRDFPELIRYNNTNNKRIADFLRNLSLVKMTTQTDSVMKHVDDVYRKQHKKGVEIFDRLFFIHMILRVWVVFVRMALIAYAAYLALEGGYTVATLVTLLFWLQWALGNFPYLSKVHRSLVIQWEDIVDFCKLFQLKSDVLVKENPHCLDHVEGEIIFDKVTYEYPLRAQSDDDTEVEKDQKESSKIQGISLKIKAGEKVAFVGPSGAGKTTLLKLMLRAMDPQKGSVLIDGVSLRDIDPEDWYHHIGLVDQEVNILDISIRQNLLLGLQKGQDHLSDDELREVLRGVGLDDFQERLDVQVGEKGIKLSGGERQRIAIARCLLRNAEVFFIDEATSNLDAHSEYVVTQTLEKVTEGKTVIFVAHRLATIKHVDRIFYIEDGKILAIGNHEELQKSCESYAHMVKRQSL